MNYRLDKSSYYPHAMDFYTAGAGGLIADVSRVALLGQNPDVDLATQPEDVWNGASIGVLNGIDHKNVQIPQSAVSIEVVSDSANDTSAGTGLRTMLVGYLDASFAAKTTIVTLNGTTPVAFPETIRAVNSMIRVTTGTFKGANIGNVSLRASGGLGATYGYMAANTGFTRSSLFTVPAASTLYIWSMVFDINRTDTNLRVVNFSFPILNASGALAKALVLTIGADLPYRHESSSLPVLTVTEKTSIWITVESGSIDNINVTAGYNALLIKNTRLVADT